VRLANVLLGVSAVVFALIGIGYLVAPGFMLGIAGVQSEPTSDFLLRTEGVALLTGSVLIYAVMRSGGRAVRIALIALAAYYVVGSLVDLAAFANGLLDATSVASAAVRLVFGAVCAFAVATYSTPESSRE
jgi:hypothetical protein